MEILDPRIELYIVAIIDGTDNYPKPSTYEEFFWAKLAGYDIGALPPMSIREHILDCLTKKTVPTVKPFRRVDKFLAKAAGADVKTPKPIARIEQMLDGWTPGGGVEQSSR